MPVFSSKIETSVITPFDLNTSLSTFNNLNTNFEHCLYVLWEAYSDGYDHPLVLQLKKQDKFFEFDYVSAENIFMNHTIETLPDDMFQEITQEIPSIRTKQELRTFKQNAVYILVRNYELDAICKTIVNFLSRVPYPYYDFIILNDKPFSPVFVNQISHYILNSNNPITKKWSRRLITIKFGLIPAALWDPLTKTDGYISFPLSVLEEKWEEQEKQGILYGGSKSYRNMCRFQSMNFYNHPAMAEYKYTMRMEPGVEYMCNFDPFSELNEGVKYAFALSLLEYQDTVPTLFKTYLEYEREEDYRSKKLFDFINDGAGGYNLCHFWTNFEVISLEWVRSEKYNTFMQHFDSALGFYTERWGDAPVRTLAVVELLDPNEVQWLDIGYYHAPFVSCPGDAEERVARQCTCEPFNFEANFLEKTLDNEDNEKEKRLTIDMHDFSCLRRWWRFGDGKFFTKTNSNFKKLHFN